MKKSLKQSQKIVIKVGSSILTGGGAAILAESLKRVVGHIARFSQEGKSVIVVTSGAIASGLSVLGLTKKPKELELLQAAAAAGQNILMQSYSESLAKKNLKCAQILLTKEDFQDRQRYLNARNTINALLKYGVIPIINENDSVAVEEIWTLSMLVATASTSARTWTSRFCSICCSWACSWWRLFSACRARARSARRPHGTLRERSSCQL